MPDTLVTNSPVLAHKFAESRRVVSKAVSSGEGIAPFVDEPTLDDLDLVETVPTVNNAARARGSHRGSSSCHRWPSRVGRAETTRELDNRLARDRPQGRWIQYVECSRTCSLRSLSPIW